MTIANVVMVHCDQPTGCSNREATHRRLTDDQIREWIGTLGWFVFVDAEFCPIHGPAEAKRRFRHDR